MVNLKGLDILGTMKAGAQERTKPALVRSSNKESSFKEVLGQSEQKQESKFSEKENVGKETIGKDSSGKETGTQENYKKEIGSKEAREVKGKATQEVVGRDQTAPVKAEQNGVSGESIPGSPSPTTPPFARTTPDFNGVAPTVVQPIAKQPAMNQMASEEGVDSLTRRVVWNDFLRKMNDELGVTADKVLEAFSSLNESELNSPPEQNVEKLVMALGLNPQQSEVAQKLFTDLIKKTQSKSLGDELASSATQINLSLMSQREVQRKHIQNSLDKMNSQFFMSRQGIQPQQPKVGTEKSEDGYVPAPELGAAPLELSQVPQDLSAASVEAKPEVVAPLMPKVQSSPNKSTTPAFDKLIQQMQPVSAQEQKQFIDTSAAKSSVNKMSDMMSAMTPANAAAPVTVSEAPLTTAAVAKSSAGSATAIANAVSNAFSNLQGQMNTEAEDSGDELQDGELLQEMPTDRNNLGAKVENGFSLSPTQPILNGNEVAKPMAVPELIQNARIMVRDGGGEMKVTLTPEGLGEVAMKVSVDNGRVNVQMITESDEAKKMIEKGLVDLKSSLHANNLSLDSIKVDTASNMGHQLEQQYRDAQKQQAQQFLENFRQDQQGWRRNFFEPPTAQLTRSQVQGSSNSGTPYYNANSKRAGSRRLDLVA